MPASPTPSSDDQFAIGSILDDRYRIEAVLGSGGMGCVYRAEHTKIGKSVAIKVLHADLTRNREASQRFQREVIALGRLDHTNIVGVSDFGVLDNGACFLVMEVLEGESLGDRLARDKRIHWVEALDIMRGMLFGLRHAHERGVVHRDIKPDNIYLAHKDGEPVIKILDFGIAKLYAGNADDPASTRAGLTVGTPAYLSPEQAVGGEISPASDLYSASIVLYEMLAGRAPFEDKDPLAMLGAHVSRPPPRFAVIAPGVDVPPQLEDIIHRGLSKPAAERISTANEYLALIDAFSPPLHPYPRGGTAPVEAPAEASGPAPQSGATVAGTAPAVGSAAVRPVAAQPAVDAATRPVDAATPLPVASMATPLPRAIRAVSLADVSEPIPLTWIVRSGVVIGLVIIAAIALAIGAHCRGGAEPAAGTAEAGAKSRAPEKPASGAGAASADGKPAPVRPDSGGKEAGAREPGGREPGGREPGGREPGGREPGGREPAGDTGGRDPGGREPAREPGGRDATVRGSSGREATGRDEPATKPEPASRPVAAPSSRPTAPARPAASPGKPRPGAGSGSARRPPGSGR